MTSASSRLSKIAAQLLPTYEAGHQTKAVDGNHHVHSLSPTYFLPRAAAIEPDGIAIYHVTSNKKVIRKTYAEFADRARGFAYYLKKKGYKRLGILAPNTPAFLEALFSAGGAGAVNIAINYRLVPEDISRAFVYAEADIILVDAEYEPLLRHFRITKPNVLILVDTDTDSFEPDTGGGFSKAVVEGYQYDEQLGSEGWNGLLTQVNNENDTISLASTSGTTARPKLVEYTHRGLYLAALANVVESGLNIESEGQKARYLWTLPMFHANGWTFPWSITSVRATHYCLRKIEYTEIWRILKTEGITHFNCAPTVSTLLCASANAERISSPVRVTVAASPPSALLFKQMMALNLFPVHVYGLTETYGPITKCYIKSEWNLLPEDEKFEKMARQGNGFITSQAVRVVKRNQPNAVVTDVAKDGQEIGEIVFSGNICAKGYYKDPEATKQFWLGGVAHSGDLAVWYSNSEINIIDRVKDIIISGGENISSIALESLLGSHPNILEIAVIAVEDEQWGERPKAYVTVKQGSSISGQDILSWAKNNNRISKFMLPSEIVVLDELPKTTTGKIQKVLLRDWAKKRDNRA